MPSTDIWHGDSRELVHRIRGPIHCIVADPPYGVDFVSRRAETTKGKGWVQAIENDDNVEGAIQVFHEVMRPLVKLMPNDGELYVFTRWDIVDQWMEAVRSIDPEVAYKMLLIWDKGVPGMGDIDANWGCGHELILYCKKGRRDVAYRRSSIIHVDKVPNTQHIHPTEKPVPLLEILIKMSTDTGDLVVDPFSGSGSTVVAAQNTGRRGLGIEQDAVYVKRSRSRLEQGSLFG